MNKLLVILSLSFLLVSCKNTRDYTVEQLENMTPPLGGIINNKQAEIVKEQKDFYIKQMNEDIYKIETYGSKELKTSDEYKQLLKYWNGLIHKLDVIQDCEVANVLDPIRIDKYIEQIEFYKKEINRKYFENK